MKWYKCGEYKIGVGEIGADFKYSFAPKIKWGFIVIDPDGELLYESDDLSIPACQSDAITACNILLDFLRCGDFLPEEKADRLEAELEYKCGEDRDEEDEDDIFWIEEIEEVG